MKKHKRFFFDFWPYVSLEDTVLFWGLVVITIVITYMGGWIAFFAGLLFVLSFGGYLSYENDKLSHYFDDVD